MNSHVTSCVRRQHNHIPRNRFNGSDGPRRCRSLRGLLSRSLSLHRSSRRRVNANQTQASCCYAPDFSANEPLADIHLEVPTYQAGRSILRFGSSKSGWITHTHTSRHGLDVPRRGKCYIPKDKSTVNSAEEQRARGVPLCSLAQGQVFQKKQDVAEACGSRTHPRIREGHGPWF